jgi:drug/metabolite transporter (DMT)-like permease
VATVLLAVTMVMVWSFNYVAGKVAVEHMPALAVASFRLVVAGAIYTALLLARRERLSRLGRADLPAFLLLGLTGVFINQGGFTLSLKDASVPHVALIAACGPVMVLLMAWLTGLESLTVTKVAGMAVAFGGILALTAHEGLTGHTGALTGDLLAVCSTVGFALFTVSSKRFASGYDPLTVAAFAGVVGGVLALPFAVVEAHRLDWTGTSWQGWAGMLYMAIASSVIAYLIFYRLIRRLEASQVASLNFLLPVIGVVLGVVLLHEPMNRYFALPASLIAVGVWLAERARRQAARTG